MPKIILNETTEEWVKSLEPLEYTDISTEAMVFGDEATDVQCTELESLTGDPHVPNEEPPAPEPVFGHPPR